MAWQATLWCSSLLANLNDAETLHIFTDQILKDGENLTLLYVQLMCQHIRACLWHAAGASCELS